MLPPLLETYRRLVESPRFAELYPEYLFIQHTIVRASVPLMEEASARLSALPCDEDLAVPLRRYLSDHIDEERHHDEWILEDLAALGKESGDVLARVPPPEVAAMVGSQYYWIRHHHPVVVLGYIAVLEGSPPSSDDLDRVVARSALPREAFRTWAEHAAVDPEHLEDLDAVIDCLPLSDVQVAAMAANAVSTVRLATASYRGLVD